MLLGLQQTHLSHCIRSSVTAKRKSQGFFPLQCIWKYFRDNICGSWTAYLFFFTATKTFTQLIMYFQQVISAQLLLASKTGEYTTAWEQSYKHFKYALIWIQWSSIWFQTANMYSFNNNKWHFRSLKQSPKHASWVMSPLTDFTQPTIRSIYWSLIAVLQQGKQGCAIEYNADWSDFLEFSTL